MTEERVLLLDSLGFSWDVRHSHGGTHQQQQEGQDEAAFLYPVGTHQHDRYLTQDIQPEVAAVGMAVAGPTVAPDCMLQVQQSQTRSNNANPKADVFANGITMV